MKLRRATKRHFKKKRVREAAKRFALKEEGGAAYEDALKKDSKRKRLAKSVQWYRQAADQGDAAAQFGLGVAYEYGRGVKKSDEKAVLWYRQAADQKHAAAQFFMGLAYKNGRGVDQSYEGAVQWYRKAADQGDDSIDKMGH